jgi:hypothetical protein
VRWAVSASVECVDIGEQDMWRCLQSRDMPEVKETVVGRVKCVVILDTFTDCRRLRVVGNPHMSLESAQMSYATLFSLLALFPGLKILELVNTFCARKSFEPGGKDELRHIVHPPIAASIDGHGALISRASASS